VRTKLRFVTFLAFLFVVASFVTFTFPFSFFRRGCSVVGCKLKNVDVKRKK